MSRRTRHGDGTAPAMFPFLAVLLCTIGALVLMLAITVTSSHASARRDAKLSIDEVENTTNQVEVISEELDAQREIIKSKIERRRRDLADIEDHIERLKKNLERLVDQLNRIQSQTSDSESSIAEKDRRLAEIRSEIEEKRREILDEIEKQKRRKPAFAVIPYSGKSGTSRRPVYLECTKAGIVIQPEGLLISANDLKPPFGPGNPLDAALRVLRLAYQQRDTTFGITQPPYPLLLVRPDGIQSYAYAREAMSGWDDQFGYELINADMDLKFPTGIPGLKDELVSTIDLAKKRQQVYLASMPRSILPRDEDSWDSIDAVNAAQGGTGPNFGPTGSSSAAPGTGTNSIESSGQASSATQEWKLVQGIANSQVTSAIQKNGDVQEANAYSNDSSPKIAFPSEIPPPSTNERASELDRQFRPVGAGKSPTKWSTESGQGSLTMDSASNSGSSAGSASANMQQGGAGGGAMGSQTPNSSNVPPSQGQTAMMAGSATGTPVSELFAEKGNPQDLSPGSLGGSVQQNASTSSSSPKSKYVNPDGDLKPISVSAGRGWAASRAEGKATPVARQIHLVALNDRWLLRSDSDPNSFEVNILMDEGPQQAGNHLATAIRKRVDSWGLSLPGGYWAPTLTIESANDSQHSVARLERLLDGSGVEIHVVPLRLPNRR
ncbi:MAG: hypothetical protein ABL921_11870 [Pirellula sp.]